MPGSARWSSPAAHAREAKLVEGIDVAAVERLEQRGARPSRAARAIHRPSVRRGRPNARAR